MEINELLEGKKTDNLEGTSTSEEIKSDVPADIGAEPIKENAPEEAVPDLATTPVPTEEEVKDASLEVKPEEVVNAEPINNEPLPEAEPNEVAPEQSEAEPSEPISTENVAAEEPVENAEENGVSDLGSALKFTQSQVNEMVGKTRTETREKTLRYIYGRYGVKDEAELDELVGNAQALDSFKEKYDTERAGWKQTSADRDKELMEVKEQVALLQSGIDSDRFEDAKFILKGKGLEVNLDNIKNELATHPEWQKKVTGGNENFAKTGEGTLDTKPTEPSSKISVLGNENIETPNPANAEEDYALTKMFKVK